MKNRLFIPLTIAMILLAPLSAAAQAPVAAPIAAPTDALYVVQPGDWLSTIALRLYGDARLYPQIVEATNARAAQEGDVDPIANPDLIEIGQRLWTPGNDAALAPETRALAGIYKGVARSADCCGRDITLFLNANGTANLTTDFMNGDAPILEEGRWAMSNQTVTLTLTGQPDRAYDQPEITMLAVAGHTLAPNTTAYPTLVAFGALAMGEAHLPYDAAVIQARWDAGEWPDILKAFLPAASCCGQDITLYINVDGTARMITDYLNGKPAIEEVGIWAAADGGVQITLTGRPSQAPYAQADVLQLTPRDGVLQAQGAQHGAAGIAFYSVRGLATAP